MTHSEFSVFILITLSGIFVGFCFDIYRIIRWQLGLNRVLTFIGDLLFSFIAILIIFYFAQKANYLEMRFYLFGGALLGLLIYLQFWSSASKKLFKAVLRVITNLKNLLVGIILFICKSLVRFLTLLMSVPYGLLRWFALLLFRMGEALLPRHPKQ